MTIFYYEAGNPASLAAVRDAAEHQTRNNVMLFPRPIGTDKMGAGIERIPPNNAGEETLYKLVQEYFNAQIKSYVLGQVLSSDTAPTGLGSEVAKLHGETLAKIIRYDSNNLDETITTDFLWVMQRANYPGTAMCRFRSNVDKPNIEGYMGAVRQFFDMGGKVKENEVRSRIGLSAPKEGDAVLQSQQYQPQGMGMQGGAPGMPGAPMGQGAQLMPQGPGQQQPPDDGSQLNLEPDTFEGGDLGSQLDDMFGVAEQGIDESPDQETAQKVDEETGLVMA